MVAKPLGPPGLHDGEGASLAPVQRAAVLGVARARLGDDGLDEPRGHLPAVGVGS